MYGFVGRFSDIIFVNSSWTSEHIKRVWNVPSRMSTVFPPCNTDDLVGMFLKNRERIILSVGQFRPEKAHLLQLKAFRRFLELLPDCRIGEKRVELILLGGCRNSDDEDRVNVLQELCKKMGIENAKYEVLLKYYSKASIGLHTMWNEHFGIGIVEYMAAGLIPIAHNSGGPKMDIVNCGSENRTVSKVNISNEGFLATSEEEYALDMKMVFELKESESTELRSNARESVKS
ncbi:asparagine-linked glycosylation protein, partial [Nowakowskiella sp. JEL0078]